MFNQGKEMNKVLRCGLSNRVVIIASLFILLLTYFVKNIQSNNIWQTRLNISSNISYNIKDFINTKYDKQRLSLTKDYNKSFDNENIDGLFIHAVKESINLYSGDISFRTDPLIIMSNSTDKIKSKDNLDKFISIVESKVRKEIVENIYSKNELYLKKLTSKLEVVRNKSKTELSKRLFELNSANKIAKSLNIENPIYNFNGESIFPFYLGTKVLSEEINILKSERARNIYYPNIVEYEKLIKEANEIKVKSSDIEIIKVANVDFLYKARFGIFNFLTYAFFGLLFGFLINLIYSLKKNDYK